MKQVSLLIKALFSRRWWWATLLVVGIIAVFVRLGIWQLDRLQQRRAQNAELVAALNAPPIGLAEELPPLDNLEALKDRDVVVAGEYDFEHQMALKLQNWQGRPGVHLVAPLLIEGLDTAVLVDRGWIPDAEAAVSNWSQFDQPGPVTISGTIALPQTLSRRTAAASSPSDFQQEVYRVDIEQIQPTLPYELLPFYVLQAPSPDGSDELPLRSEPQIDLSEGPHLGYAIQWFLFSLIATGGYTYFVFKNSVEQAVDAESS